ncbi:hypothetical protein [Bacillus altitudinis]|uniref:hypothetical protein n=1 Tax=Bacillus altitudinis TaxID=293387 RepID=UPI003B51B16A
MGWEKMVGVDGGKMNVKGGGVGIGDGIGGRGRGIILRLMDGVKERGGGMGIGGIWRGGGEGDAMMMKVD